jgi:hypothetical protein
MRRELIGADAGRTDAGPDTGPSCTPACTCTAMSSVPDGVCVRCLSGSACEYDFGGTGTIVADCVAAASCALRLGAGMCCVVYCSPSNCGDVPAACRTIEVSGS